MIDWEEIKRDIYTVGSPKENNRAYQEVCKAEAEIATLQEAVMLLKKRNYAKEDEIAALQARVAELQKWILDSGAIMRWPKPENGPTPSWLQELFDRRKKILDPTPTTEK